MKCKNIFLAVLGIFIFTSFLFAEEKNDQADYTIHTNDVLQISVYNEPDLDKTVRVSGVGTVNYPLLGNIIAANISIRELEKNIADALSKEYLVSPQVHVFIKEYGSKVSVLGQVKKPGTFELKGRMTLMEAIAAAGDFSETGNPARVKVLREVDNKEETYEIDTTNITGSADNSKDLELQPSDVVVVEEYGRISVLGQVNRPGSFVLKKNLTALEAIALAGGFTKIAAIDGTRVIRQQDGRKQVFPIKVSAIMRGDRSYDIPLESGDTISVPESFF